jgi:hypothetical protein
MLSKCSSSSADEAIVGMTAPGEVLASIGAATLGAAVLVGAVRSAGAVGIIVADAQQFGRDLGGQRWEGLDAPEDVPEWWEHLVGVPALVGPAEVVLAEAAGAVAEVEAEVVVEAAAVVVGAKF